MQSAIHVRHLSKSFGDTAVLRDLDLDVPQGKCAALLGANGAGKTTLISILATLLDADDGEVSIAGHDLAAHPNRVRAAISVIGQSDLVDPILTGRENLIAMARLWGLTKPEAAARADDLLEEFGLTQAGRRRAGTYSGGMRRQLDLATGLVRIPEVMFLDEPTTGLDPPSREAVWQQIRDLKREGTTILLTTHYPDEADALADWFLLLKDGRITHQEVAR